jgi:hypothetical protein
MLVGSRFLNWLRSRMDARLFPWSIVGILAALTPLFGWLVRGSTAAGYREDPPSCYGIGWGCKLDPASSGLLAALVWGVGVVAVAGALALTEFFWRRIATARSAFALITLGFGVALMLWASALIVLQV